MNNVRENNVDVRGKYTKYYNRENKIMHFFHCLK